MKDKYDTYDSYAFYLWNTVLNHDGRNIARLDGVNGEPYHMVEQQDNSVEQEIQARVEQDHQYLYNYTSSKPIIFIRSK